MTSEPALAQRIDSLEKHLKAENPILLEAVPLYRRFDKLLYRMGLLKRSDSLTGRISWWPLIAVLGTFSAGKSSFINGYLGQKLQRTGNQAVDDKFTVVCYGADTKSHTLPGNALDADPRFPFYRMSHELEKMGQGEGKRVDTYLQLRTSSSDRARGKILVDSPGFDADDQRTAILRLTDHMLDLADLVLVFFDSRHPEPGAMQDTLRHLVAKAVKRADSSKFVYVLNQIDTTAREDNAEEVFGAWQRAIAQAGLMTGRFYGIYNKDAAVTIEDPQVRARYEARAAADLNEITQRIDEVEIGRAYRVVGLIDTVGSMIETEILPALSDALARWRRRVWLMDAAIAAGVLAVGGVATAAFGPAWILGLWSLLSLTPLADLGAIVVLAIIIIAAHQWSRSTQADIVARSLSEQVGDLDLDLRGAFRANTRFWRTMKSASPAGWGAGARAEAGSLREAAAALIQRLNDRFTDPAGRRGDRDKDAGPADVTGESAFAKTA